MRIEEMIEATHGMSIAEICEEIDRKIASCDVRDVKGIANLQALKSGFLLGSKVETKP